MFHGILLSQLGWRGRCIWIPHHTMYSRTRYGGWQSMVPKADAICLFGPRTICAETISISFCGPFPVLSGVAIGWSRWIALVRCIGTHLLGGVFHPQ
jgi:hypothetical protein